MEERRMPNQLMHLAIDFETTKFIVRVGWFNLSSSPSWWSSSFVCFRASRWIKSVQPRSQNVARPTPIGKSRCTCVGMFFFTENYSLSFVRNRMLEQRVHRSSTMMSSSFIKVESMSSMKWTISGSVRRRLNSLWIGQYAMKNKVMRMGGCRSQLSNSNSSKVMMDEPE